MKNQITFFLMLLFAIVYNASFAQDGVNDATFNPTDTGYSSSTNAPIKSVVVQADGKLLICGEFTQYTGVTRNHIARLNSDETLDISFSPAGADDDVDIIVIQPDGKFLIGGLFTQYNGIARSGIARLNSDGTLDETFNPGTGLTPGPDQFNRRIHTITLQPDGKIIIGGYFGMYNGVQVGRIARLNSNGTLDETFLATGTSWGVLKTALQPDGKIIVSGTFNNFNGIQVNAICRLNTNGTTDTTFNTSWFYNVNAINNIIVKADGKILITGYFSYLTGNTFSDRNIVQLNNNGSRDTTFEENFFSVYQIQSVVIQPDNKILLAGAFLLTGEDTHVNLLRLNSDGSNDTSFTISRNFNDRGLNTTAECVALLPDGTAILAGGFMSYGNVVRHFLARVTITGLVDETYTINNGAGANNTIYTSLLQRDGKIVIAGPFNYYNGQAARSMARLNQDGSIDATFNSVVGANAPIRLSALQPDGKIIIIGDFTAYNGVPINKVARINSDGSLDAGFNLDSTIDLKTSYSVKVLDNGKVLIGGYFQYNGGEYPVHYYTIFKLNADGSLDNSFALYEARAPKNIVALPNGKIMVAYGYYYANFGIQYSVARLNSDGTLDNTFEPVPYTYLQNAEAMVVQPDGKVIVYGYNSSGINSARFIRLNTDGSIDNTFTRLNSSVATVKDMVLQPNGKLIISGPFNYFARINSDGSTDDTFNFGLGVGTGRYFSSINNIHLLNNGNLLITGSFKTYNGAGRNRIARIMSNGSMATDFPHVKNNEVFAYKNGNALQVESLVQAIAQVSVYDLSGRLLSDTGTINTLKTSVDDISPSNKILIVNIKLADNTTLSKKIYF
jgi:uncharacterized delta-60 repeat protein